MNFVAIPIIIRNPAQVVLAAAAVSIALWLTAPIEFLPTGGSRAAFMLFAYVALFFVGILAGFRRWRSSTMEMVFDMPRLHRTAKTVALLGGFGLALRVYERVVLRAGGAVTTDFVLNRDLIAGGGSGPLSFLGLLLGTMLMLLPIFVMLLRAGGQARGMHRFYMILSLAYPLFDLLLMGSRSTLLIYSGLVLASILTTRTVLLKPKMWIVAVVGGLALVWLAGFIFWLRTTQSGQDPVVSMYTSGYSEFVPPSDAVLAKLRADGISGIGGLLFGYVHFCQYMLHGLYEFLYVAANVSGASTNGQMSFYIPLKFVNAVAGSGAIEDVIASGMLRPGVYTTLFGPMLYDYGPLGCTLASFLFGFGAGSISRAVRRGRVALLPLHVLVIGLLPFTFAVNLFTSGTGQFLMLGGMLLILMLKLPRFRIHLAKARRAL